MSDRTPIRPTTAALAAGVAAILTIAQIASSAEPLALPNRGPGAIVTDAAATDAAGIDLSTGPMELPGGRFGSGAAIAEASHGPAPTIGEETTTTEAPAAGAPVVAASTSAPADGPPQLAARGSGIPVGKGMWIWMPARADGGDPAAIVNRAVAHGLTHIYVRTGSSRQGFEAAAFLEALLPVAHAAGLRVYGWDFPYLEDVQGDVDRAMTAINFRTTTGHRIDGFVPDIETQSEGTNLSAETAGMYSMLLRQAVGEDYPLVACVPHPSPQRMGTFPYAAVLPFYDAVAPMTYWLNRQPDTDVAHAVTWLSQFGKPVIPVGQAYDGAPEGGRPGPPPADEIHRFISAAERHGAHGVSFWSWQHATQEIWDAIRDAPHLRLPIDDAPLGAAQVLAVQRQLTSMGYWAPPTGVWDEQTVRALTMFQIELGLVPTGVLDAGTRARLLGPLAPAVGR